MYEIISPRNSFVQFDEVAPVPHCIWGDMRKCLPLVLDTDVTFQFIVRAGTIGEADALCALDNNLVSVGLVADCNQGDFDVPFPQMPSRFRLNELDVLYNWNWGLPGAVAEYAVGDCFYILVAVNGVGHCSNCFQRIGYECFSNVLAYRNDEDGFGFWYCSGGLNRIRLPFYLRQPQFPTELNQFRLADGTTKTISAVVRKTYNIITDQMHEDMLQKMAIALVHDTVTIEGTEYSGGIAMDGEFQITWQEFLDYPLGIANFTVQVTPFAETNNNCQTCDEPLQLQLEDDEIYGDLDEGETAVINVFANDVICCSPITAEIVSFNAAFVNTVAIDPLTGNVTINIKNPAPSATDIILATYRVTCQDGGFAESNIYGSVVGTAPSCLPASGLVVEDMDADLGTAHVSWTASPSAPADGYQWFLWKCEDLSTHIQSGTTSGLFVDLNALSPGQCYAFVVNAACETGVFYSSALEGEFTMPGTSSLCGKFILENSDPSGDNPFLHVTYMDCNGALQNTNVRTPMSICALTDSFGNMIYLAVDLPGLTVTPDGTC